MAYKYNILMLNYEFPPIGGGAGQAHYRLLQQYASMTDLKVDVLTSGLNKLIVTERLSENITIYKVGIHKKNLHYWRKIEVLEWLFRAKGYYRRLVDDGDYDLVHAFFGFPTGWLCYRDGKLPYIISLRGSDVPGFNIRLGLDYKLLAGSFRRIWQSASAVIANSRGLQKLALSFMPELNIKVIPNGVDVERFSPSPDKKLSRPLQILTVSRLISRKRIDVLIEAVAKMQQGGLDVCLNIAGEGNLLGNLQKLSVDLSVASKVRFLSRVPNEQMPDIYRRNDIFVMSSAHEGMSNAMLEAMACGLPIVSSSCEGTEELIADNGVIVPQADPELFAQAIKKLADSPEVYLAMSRKASEQAKKFSWHNTAGQYYNLYGSIAKAAKER